MRTKLITGLKKEVLVIEAKSKDIAWGFMFNKYGLKELLRWELLGSPDEIKEENVKDLVDLFSIESGRCQDYIRPECGYVTAIESFNSALESEIYWDVNPVKLENIVLDDGTELNSKFKTKEFEEAEHRTFDRNRTLIFVKI